MPTPIDLNAQTILSVIRIPPALNEDDFAQLVASNSGLDFHALRLLGTLVPPQILGMVLRKFALQTIHALQQLDGDAFAPALEEIINLGPSIRLKSITPAGELLRCELWRAPDHFISLASIRVLVRAPQLNTLDMHTNDNRVFQVAADKFNFSGLGAARGLSDLANMNALTVLLTSLAPDVIVDEFFPLWKPHPILEKVKLPGMTLHNENPAFAFYSRWVAHMYRHIAQ